MDFLITELIIIFSACPAHTRPPAIEPPLNKWIWILKDTTQGSNAFYEALKLISEFENHPSPDECDGIDLKFLYNTMADLFVGDLPAELDQKHNEFLKTTFRKLRDFTINSEKNDKVEFILNITRLFPDLGKNNRNDSEINLIPGFLEYCSKTNFNPLDVPLTFLKNDVKLKKPEEFY